jgi:hypothetical protein
VSRIRARCPEHVIGARHERYHHCHRHHDNPRHAERTGQHVEADRDHLQQGFQLATPARSDDTAPYDGKAEHRDTDLA